MSEHLASRDVFIRLTDPTGKRADVINQHRAWDPEAFVASQVKQYDSDAKPDERLLVTVATEADYRKYRGYRRTAR